MPIRVAPLLAVVALLSLGGCGSAPRPAALVERPPDSRFVANLPDGPITPPAEPESAAAALAEAKAGSNTRVDPPAQLALWQKAAAAGSPEGRYQFATMLSFGAAGPDKVGDGFDMLLDLAKQGHGQAAMSLWRLSKLSRSGNLNQHAPYWFNIARRSGDATAVEVYDKLLAEYRAKGELPPSTGTGDYFNNPIVFTPPVDLMEGGLPLEAKVVSVLYPGWELVGSAFAQQDGKSIETLVLENVEAQRVKVYFDITAWRGVQGM